MGTEAEKKAKAVERMRLWRKNNLDRYKAQGKKWRDDNPDKNKEYMVKWYVENKDWLEKTDKRRAYRKAYNKENSITLKWRQLLLKAISRMNDKKKDKTINLLGYTQYELKNHLESLFTEGMSWDNHGEWHIDHIKPVSKFDKDTHPSIVNALSNLQPLWATTREINGVIYEGNLNKSDNY